MSSLMKVFQFDMLFFTILNVFITPITDGGHVKCVILPMFHIIYSTKLMVLENFLYSFLVRKIITGSIKEGM